ncbi:MAG: hypothetical protein ACTSVG_00440 [Alphaproteobacteria bacterium]
MNFEYKAVGAPEKAGRKRGRRSRSDRVAVAFEEILKAEAVDGWEYQRTDLLPVTESAGWFKRGHEVHRAVMVFRRPLDRARMESDATRRRAPSVTPAAIPAATPAAAPTPERGSMLEPKVSDDPDLRLADTLRGAEKPLQEG